jgi:acyl-coenzyme A synthetase/AMP-(fatty) acid ligase
MKTFSFLNEAAERWPEVPAIISAQETLSFKQLRDRAWEVKNVLEALGIRPGLGLGLVAQDSAEFLVGLFAGVGCGAVVMPISHQLKQQEFQRVLELVPVAAILHDGSLRHLVRGQTTAELHGLTLITRTKEFFHRVASGVPDAAVIRFTSGTTGSSKGVVLSHHSVEERTTLAAQGLQLSAGDRVTWVLPMAYHFIVSIVTYVRFGVTIVLPESITAPDICRSVDRDGSSLIYASPAIIQMLAYEQSALSLPSTVRVISTSSGLSAEHAQAFFGRFSIAVEQMYGLIEVGLPLGNSAPQRHSNTSVGKALPGYEVAILSETQQPLPVGCIGNLAVKGRGMFDAYLAPYRPRDEVLINGWFPTGDIAMQASDGSVVVCGRAKSVINAGGNKVFPEEVEGVLNSFPGIQSSRVFGFNDKQLGEVVAAELLPHKNIEVSVTAVADYCGERLSPYKVPRDIRIVDRLPLTDSGKIVRSRNVESC